MNQNLQQTKAHYEYKMKDLVVKLTEREAEITNLEMRLKTLAYDDQMPISRDMVSDFVVIIIKINLNTLFVYLNDSIISSS